MTTSSADETVVLPVADDDVPPDGLAAELAQAAPRRWHNRATLPLAALVLVAGGFLGGALVQKNFGAAQPAAGRNFPAGGFAAGGGFGQRSGAGNQGAGNPGAGNPGAGNQGAADPGATAGGATTGTVKLVDGSTIYVETADGTTITVKTGKDTSVRTSKAAKLSDVKAGAKVTVQGTTAGEDTVTATAVTTR
ncbi:hypothetical protein [Actinoplanes sp. NPDC049265]|uniref:hypothetical protein n=1 Tax=Actinoplanes sp. NPDC049265 TaxID=3363902 RepID=UPI00371241E1